MHGPLANMIEVLSNEGGFMYDIACSEGGGTGLLFPNGTWTGLVGDLNSKKADLALSAMGVTYDRLQVVNYPPQINTEYFNILAGLPDVVDFSAFGALMAFEWQVWLGLFCALMVCVLTSVLVDVRNGIHRSSVRIRESFGKNWWLYVSAMFMESSTHTPRSTAGRLVLAAWWLTVVVLMNAFTGHMKATLMLFPEPERIDSFMDLSHRKDVTPFLWGGGAYEELLKKSLDVEEYRGLWNLIIARDGLRDEAHLYTDDNLRLVLEGKAVIVSDYTTMLYQASRACRRHLAPGSYYFAKERAFPTTLAMGVSRSADPALVQFINQRVSWLTESGVLKAWLETQLGDWRSCLLADHEDTYSPLSLFEIQSVFTMFLICIGFAIAVFIGELHIAGAMKKARRKRRVRGINLITPNNPPIRLHKIRALKNWASGETVEAWQPASVPKPRKLY
ncbi:glutamate receptor 2-like isoform X2 [Dermacentor variabilis]